VVNACLQQAVCREEHQQAIWHHTGKVDNGMAKIISVTAGSRQQAAAAAAAALKQQYHNQQQQLSCSTNGTAAAAAAACKKLCESTTGLTRQLS